MQPQHPTTPPRHGTAAPAADPTPGLARVRGLWVAAVDDEGAIERGLREVDRLAHDPPAGGGLASRGRLEAYRGAFITLRAKHALWPPAKVRHLRDGLEILDAAVDRHPGEAEIRYVRLMSCYYLPALFGRKASVREDFAALARLLPEARDDYPEEAYRAIVDFVLERGGLDAGTRAPLERALAAADG